MARHQVVKRHSAKRRMLEFNVVRHHVKKDKERLIRRLEGLVASVGDCVLFLGSRRIGDGYGRLTFRYNGKHVTIDAQRVFLILALHRPIRLGFDAGHTNFCLNKHCVRHLFEQPSGENGREANKRKHGTDTPF